MKNKGLIQPGVTNVTDEAPLPSYLVPRGAVYYIRRVVPQHLRGYFPTGTGKERTEFMVSLGTKDRRVAISKAAAKNLEIQQELDAAQRKFDAGITPVAAKRINERLRDWEDQQQALEEEASAENAKDEAEIDAAFDEILDRLNSGNPLSVQDKALMRMFRPELLDPPEVQAAREAKAIAEYEKAGAEVSAAFEKHGFDAFNRPTYPRLIDLFHSYAQAAGITAATVKRWEPVVNHLIAFKKDDNVLSLTTDDLRRWRDFLLAEATEKGRPRSPTTIRETYLAAVKAMLQYAVQEGIIKYNPAAEVRVYSQKQVKLREKAFTESEAKTILSESLKYELAAMHGKLSRHTVLARRWVPWVCAYTGARVNEITQLRRQDIRKQDDIWLIRITPEAGGVKNNSAREVPLHSHIVEQGFCDFADHLSDEPIFYDPAKGRGAKSANPHYKKVGERLAEWVRDIGVNDPNIRPNHAWRHLFRTRGNTAGIPEAALEQIMGHAPANVGRAYGFYEIGALAREIEKLPRFATS